MQVNDLLAQMGGISSIARQLGISEDQTARGAAALTPAILGGFQKQAQGGGGLEGLGGLLGRLGGGGLLDEVQSPQPADVNHGNAVLGQIFGSKDVSRTVAQNAASNTGLNPDLLKKMLPLLAMAVAGYMARQKSGGGQGATQGGLGGLLGGLLGGGGTGQKQGGLASMLDRDGNGNPLDDILRRMGKG